MCPRFKRSTEGGLAFAVRATREWNKLSVDMKQSTSVKSFKRSLFKIILDNQILSKFSCKLLTFNNIYDVYRFVSSFLNL